MECARFDDSLDAAVSVTREIAGNHFDDAIFLRDATGQLSVTFSSSIGESSLTELSAAFAAKLGGYARPDSPVRDINDPAAELFISQTSPRTITVGANLVRFIDKRIVGADWLITPKKAAGIPRIAFASLKGGVGRSTALAVATAYLSRRGVRVLVVDLDLEAPGIGSMLIDEKATPKYGTLDYLVENGISGIDSEFMGGFGGESFLGGTGARVTVLPAIGTTTVENPQNALGKISRAYLEDISADGSYVAFSAQVEEMIDRVCSGGAYDVVLLDARAGLHETTAAALIGLGAENLLFGLDEPQTYLGYKMLLAHLANLPSETGDTWRDRVQFVHAKAAADLGSQVEAHARFRELYGMLARHVSEDTHDDELTADDFEFVWSDDDFEIERLDDDVNILTILDDSRYRSFDPIRANELLDPEVFHATFSSFLEWFDAVIPQLQGLDDGG